METAVADEAILRRAFTKRSISEPPVSSTRPILYSHWHYRLRPFDPDKRDSMPDCTLRSLASALLLSVHYVDQARLDEAVCFLEGALQAETWQSHSSEKEE